MPVIHATEIRTPTGSTSTVEEPLIIEGPLSESVDDDDMARKYADWKTYWKSPLGMAWIGLVLSFSAMMVGLHMLLTTTTNSRNPSVANTSLNAAAMNMESTTDYWLSSYHHLYPTNSSTVVPGTAPWKALEWLATSDPLAPLPHQNNDRLVQRYALACLYFHWDGPQWLFSTAGAGWLDFVTQAAASPDGTVSILVAPGQAEGTVPNHILRGSEEEEDDDKTTQGGVMTTAQVPFHECEWLGVTCNDQEQVIGLDFKSASFVLMGIVPSELGLLSHLTSLDFSGKRITAALPKHLPAALPFLKYLDLKGNLLSTIDPEWGAWSNLDTVNLSGNKLVGTLPGPSLAKWSKLRNFDIQNNDVSGNFWQDVIPHWPLVENVDISMTELTGSIPEVTHDGPLSRLVTLYASQVALTGTLPASLSVATGLQVLQLTDTSGVGFTPSQLPSEFGRLTQLEILGLSSPTLLTGTLPTELGRMTLLRELNLYSNTGLNGTIPTEIGHLKALEILKLCYTDLSGTVPKQIGVLGNLTEVLFHKTNLVGTVPEALCDAFLTVLTADCAALREGAIPQIECKPGCCECYP